MIPLSFPIKMLTLSYGRISARLTDLVNFSAHLNRFSTWLRDAEAIDTVVICGNTQASFTTICRSGLRQRDADDVIADCVKVRGAIDKREFEATLRWAGWSKSQSITEVSRDARAVSKDSS